MMTTLKPTPLFRALAFAAPMTFATGTAFALCGCFTGAGVGLGFVIDAASPKEVPMSDLPELETGTHVKVYVPKQGGGDDSEDRRVLDGHFARVEGDRLYVADDSVEAAVSSSPQLVCAWSSPADCERARRLPDLYRLYEARLGIERGADQSASIPLSSVDRVTTRRSGASAWWWKGLIVGLVIDVAIAAVLISQFEAPEIN